MKKILLIGSLLLSILKVYADTPDVYSRLIDKEFPIIAFHAFPGHMVNRENYVRLRQCGFNIATNWIEDTTYISKILTFAQEAGVRAMINCPQTRVASEIPPLAEMYNLYPANIGYFLWDEPNANIFNKIESLTEAVKISAPEKLAFVVVLPNYASAKQLAATNYREYLEKYVNIVKPQLLSYDNYCIYKQDGELELRHGYFENLEIARDVCNHHDLPLWTFCLSTAHYDYPVPTEGHLLFEAFTSLAYGSKAIQYFGYASGTIDGIKVETAPVDQDGKPRKLWYVVRRVNSQIQRVGKLLMHCKSVGVWHTGASIPEGTTALKSSDLPGPFRRIVSGSAGVVVGHLCGEGQNYLLIVNKDFSHRQKVSIEIDRPITRITQTGSNLQKKNARITLNPGGWALYSY